MFHADPDHPEQALQISMRLFAREKGQLKKFLSENLDVFAWSPTDMPGVDPFIICHKLSILLETKLMKQNPGKMNAEHLQALNNKVD